MFPLKTAFLAVIALSLLACSVSFGGEDWRSGQCNRGGANAGDYVQKPPTQFCCPSRWQACDNQGWKWFPWLHCPCGKPDCGDYFRRPPNRLKMPCTSRWLRLSPPCLCEQCQ